MGEYGLSFNLIGKVKRFIQSLDLIIYRQRDGEKHPEYTDYDFTSKLNLCEDCAEEFTEWLNNERNF